MRLVTVGIPIFDSFLEAKNAVLDALNQDSESIHEILVSFSSSKVALGEMDALLSFDDRIKIFYSKSDLTLYSNFRRLIELASGKYFAWFCGDDRHSVNFISHQLDLISAEDGSVLSIPQFAFYDYDKTNAFLTENRTSDIYCIKCDNKNHNAGKLGIIPKTHFWFGLWARDYLIQEFPHKDYDWLDLLLIQKALFSGKATSDSQHASFLYAGRAEGHTPNRTGRTYSAGHYVRAMLLYIIATKKSVYSIFGVLSCIEVIRRTLVLNKAK